MKNKLIYLIITVLLFVFNVNAQPSNTQRLLQLQDQMENAKNAAAKRNILKEASLIPSFTSFMFISKSLNDEIVNKVAATLVAKLALNEKNIKGPAVKEILVRALPLLKGKEAVVLQSKLTQQMSSASFNEGFENLFNEKDLTGWKGLVANPIERNKMAAADLKAAEKIANEQMQKDWQVKNGLLAFQGHGDNIVTEKKYGNFEFFVDWKISKKGDAGIYLRGSPQVQIWDSVNRQVGAQVGSGGLYNNLKNKSMPLVYADNKVGEWNNFHIIMKGDKVTVYLNGLLTVDNLTFENYWDRSIPIFEKEQIELQAHGTLAYYRNIYVREIPTEEMAAMGDAANSKNEMEAVQILKIGMDYKGGKIAYLLTPSDPGYDANLQHGIIAAVSDLPGEVAWGCNDKFLAGRSSIGTGSQNTIDIASGCSVAGNAASLCSNLIQGGYDDWYLPSKDELNKLFLQMKVIGGFREVCYWSSTETGKYNACSQIFDNGFQTANDKSTTFSVRPIRSF
ncbi:MAG: DUF1080 domain-containing protein [Sediminibacterium sp.]|nr:DUF1080 domain-containing protein [Sediminibacterium sp.]